MSLGPKLMAAAAAITLIMSHGARAGSISVSPTTIELPAAGGTGILYVSNRDTQPATVQIEGFNWTQAGGTDRLETSHVLEVSPPIAQVAPGQRQIIRFLLTPGSASGAERAFRLVVSELPMAELPVAAKQGMRVLLQFSVPVFTGTPHTASRALDWDASIAVGDLLLAVHNSGNTRAKLTGLRMVTADGRKRDIAPGSVVYVLSGASRQWKFAASGMDAGDHLRIKGLDNNGEIAIDAAVVVRR